MAAPHPPNLEALKLENPLNIQHPKWRWTQKITLSHGPCEAPDPSTMRAILALMDMEAALGGAASHFGGPSALAELVSSVAGYMLFTAKKHSAPWAEMFHLVNDAGHCENIFYAMRAVGDWGIRLKDCRGFRSINSPLTGHAEAAALPQCVGISNGPLGSALPQAQGLAMAERCKGTKRAVFCFLSDGGAMEGEAREALAAIAGLAKKGQVGPFVLIISDNKKKLSGPMGEAYDMAPSFLSLKTLGWQLRELKNPHNLQHCAQSIEAAHKEACSSLKPQAIWAHTIKGYGSEACTKAAAGGHGFPLKRASELTEFLSKLCPQLPKELASWRDDLIARAETFTAAAPAAKKSATKHEKTQAGIGRALIEAAQKGYGVVSISADLPGSTGVGAFRKTYPERAFDVGVCEANMVSVGVGFSKQGFIPVVDSFAQFATTKGALPLFMGTLSQAPVIGVFSHAGFQDAADGASHQALAYFNLAWPMQEVYSLSCSGEAQELLLQAVEEFARARAAGHVPKSYLFFLGRETACAHYAKNATYKLRALQPVLSSPAPRYSLLATGPMLKEATQAFGILSERGIPGSVWNISGINCSDLTPLAEELKTTQLLVSLEDHMLVHGMGSFVSHALLQRGVCFKCLSLGAASNTVGRSAYTAKELYVQHGMDARSVAQKVALKLSQMA